MGKQNRTMADNNRISTVETEARNGRARRVVIVGEGVGGLTAATSVCKALVQLTLTERTNDHLFQALLYQLAPSVRAPIPDHFWHPRNLRQQKNTTMIMGEITEPRGRAGGRCS